MRNRPESAHEIAPNRDAFGAPDVTINDVHLSPHASAILLNRAADLFYAYGLHEADDVKTWLDDHDSLAG